MKALQRIPLPVLLLCSLCVPASCPWAAIEEQLQGTLVRVAVSSTPCSVTCGLGLKVERVCEVTPGGQRRNCSLVRSHCLSSWICGLRHMAVPAGQPVRLSCLASEPAGLRGHTYGYTWTVARGLITTNDLLFLPLRNPRPALSLAPAAEADAGTYRCDVQVLEDFKVVKRIYFGLKVIPSDLVGLDFQNSLTREQRLAAKLKEGGAGNGSRGEREPFWEKREFYEVVLGVGSGVSAGILLTFLLCCCCQGAWRR
ncbi:TMM81 protein, partial [Smithornis capensis]|nr:TMM81 protein [Smithornis capensis]